ncbi:MAG: phosphoglycerate kinase [Actinomycetota bacterium]|nr:phosphoglycerate kinase [Actinomycetota bacterium]
MRTLDDLGDVRGQRVLVRVDFNVPLSGGQIQDDTRIRAALPTLERLREGGARLVLASHLGRPRDREPELSLRPAAERLGELLGTDVALADDLDAVPDRDVVMLENVRYEPGETKDDSELGRRYAALADAYVNDAFGTAHRAHASTHAVAELVERRAAGLLLQREVEILTGLLTQPARPLVAVLGGAKVTDKIGVIDRFLELADHVLIGGAMAFPFLRAQGHATGGSRLDEEDVGPARHALDQAPDKLVLPTDLVLGDRFAADAQRRELDGVDVPEGWMGLDVGPRTVERFAAAIAGAQTVFWNGPMGAFELEPFATGTHAVACAVADCPGTTVVGGGDSVAAIVEFGLADRVTHVSTGGGASLELVEGRALPGVEVLR